jgi:spermidine/putrescine-binding protein
MKALLGSWARSALGALLLGLQACNPAIRVDEDPTGLSEIEFAKQQAEEGQLGVHRNPSSFGKVIEGVVRPREIPPQPICQSTRGGKLEDRLIELYTNAASQAPSVQEDLFHEIEGLELRNGDLYALAWWRDREAEVYPGTATAIEKKKAALPGRDRDTTICLLTWSGYFNAALLDDFERENPRIRVHVYCCDTNELMLRLLQAEADLQNKFGTSTSPHAFDIAMPSDSAVAALAAKGWLAPLLENLSDSDDEFQKNLALVDGTFRALMSRYGADGKIDLNRYCIPYRWSAIGIAYNAAFVDYLPFSWAVLLDPVALSANAWRIQQCRTSMLAEPRLALNTALLYLANMSTELSDLRAIDTARRLFTDSKFIFDRLPRDANDPENSLFLTDLSQFLDSLRNPRAQQLENFAATFRRLQQKLFWTLLRFDYDTLSAVSELSFSAVNGGADRLVSLPNDRLSVIYSTSSSNPILASMRRLASVSDDDFRSAFLFLERIAQIEDRVALLLGRSAQSATGTSIAAAVALAGSSNESRENEDHKRALASEAEAMLATLRKLKERLNSELPIHPDDAATAFSSLAEQANALLDMSNGFSPEGKMEVALNLLFSGPHTAEHSITQKMLSFLVQQDTSAAVLENPTVQTKISEAFAYLQNQDSYATYFLSDSETRTQLASGKVVLAQASNADVAWAAQRNSYIRFFLPEEGALGVVDCFVILKQTSSKTRLHVHACRTFLGYLLRPENAARMVNFSKYASTEEAALPFVDREIRNGASYVLPADPKQLTLLPVLTDHVLAVQALGWTPLIPSGVPLEHPEFKKTKSLFGVLFEVERGASACRLPE